MSLRPVDQHTLVNRHTETSRLQGARDSQDLLGGQQFHNQFRQEVARRPQQVAQPQDAKEAQVGADGGGGSQDAPDGRRRKAPADERSRPLTEPGKGQRLDIKA